MEYLVALIALTAMEIVLGIDNIVFIAILSGQLPEKQRPGARRLGLALALISRILLLLTITWIMKLVDPVFALTSLGIPESWLPADQVERDAVNFISWKDIILFAGGLFLIWKSVHEIHKKLEGGEEKHKVSGHASFTGVVIQIGILDIIFSLDSVITAVGMVRTEEGAAWKGIAVMITAISLAIVVMLIFAGKVSDFVERHPTLKMLALSFLILIGVMLVAEGVGAHFNKNYIYFAMAFSLVVEMLNMRLRTVRKRRKEAAPAQ
jgi:predicted tellurium resistance membrane protein TerC